MLLRVLHVCVRVCSVHYIHSTHSLLARVLDDVLCKIIAFVADSDFRWFFLSSCRFFVVGISDDCGVLARFGHGQEHGAACCCFFSSAFYAQIFSLLVLCVYSHTPRVPYVACQLQFIEQQLLLFMAAINYSRKYKSQYVLRNGVAHVCCVGFGRIPQPQTG